MEAPRRQNPILPVVLAWLVPGAGHLRIGRVWPGLFVFAGIVPLYVGGMALAGFENVSWARHQIYFFVHALGGVLTGAAALLTRNVVVTEPLPDKDVGTLFTAVACLLNLIAVTDVWARCRRGDPEGHMAHPESDTASAVADPAAQPPGTQPPPAPAACEGARG
jgi:hypothetical protein